MKCNFSASNHPFAVAFFFPLLSLSFSWSMFQQIRVPPLVVCCLHFLTSIFFRFFRLLLIFVFRFPIYFMPYPSTSPPFPPPPKKKIHILRTDRQSLLPTAKPPPPPHHLLHMPLAHSMQIHES